MVCVYCNSETNVTNSRPQKRSNAVWRRRQCQQCLATVTTVEKIDLETAIIVTHDTAQEPFSRDKLFISIYESCKHRKDAQVSATMLTDTIIRQLYPLVQDASIAKKEIIRICAKTLQRFDHAAGVQYIAYHRN
jgi:transcriptional repressor NrdR